MLRVVGIGWQGTPWTVVLGSKERRDEGQYRDVCGLLKADPANSRGF